MLFYSRERSLREGIELIPRWEFCFAVDDVAKSVFANRSLLLQLHVRGRLFLDEEYSRDDQRNADEPLEGKRLLEK